ncbi:MAG: IS1634 family transposase [Proteobacteria bacterium]|nr:IS1634 family transposase [Pseudomonadota bacterium]
MYIRQTAIKSRRNGEPYQTHRLVESVREGQHVRQRTIVNLGSHFNVPREQWPALVLRIEQIVSGQQDLLGNDLDSRWVGSAEQIAAQVLLAKSPRSEETDAAQDIQEVDVNSLELLRPRSVGVEHLAVSALQQLGLDSKLTELGLNGRQCGAILGNIVARMTAPKSELGTYQWLRNSSAVGELIDFDYSKISLMSLYRASDVLFKHKASIESFLYQQERSLFDFEEIITLYDLTNTYFEGQAKSNANAARGHSKEKRSDCPLVTLAIVLDGSGFPKRSEIFPGNVSEPGTLEVMLKALHTDDSPHQPTVVLDAGIASEENVAWLKSHEKEYKYLVVSRKRTLPPMNLETAEIIAGRDGEPEIHVERVINDSGEVELYCHSSQREEKDRAIEVLMAKRYEAALERVNAGLSRKGTVKKYDKILIRLGRLKQRYPRASQYYEVEVDHDDDSGLATAIRWQRTKSIDETHPGVYCLRSNQTEWDGNTLWRTYTLLTDLEAVFRCLKSELGLRPIFHHKTCRVSSHLFICVLAYHLVHTIRSQLKSCGIDLSWEGIRRVMAPQQRVTTQLKRADGRTLHIRKSTRAEHAQQEIYDALGISNRPGRIEKVIL